MQPTSPGKRLYSFVLDAELQSGLRLVKERTRLSESEQIRKGIRMWLDQQGAFARPSQLNFQVLIPKDPEKHEGYLLTDLEKSARYGIDELEILFNAARTYLEQRPTKRAEYLWKLQQARDGGLLVRIQRGDWSFVVGPLDVWFTDVVEAKKVIGAEHEPIENDPSLVRGRVPRTEGRAKVARGIAKSK